MKIVLAALFGLYAAQATAQHVYENDRYDVTATIPAGFDWLNESVSGDGAEFVRREDNSTIIAVFGRLAQQNIADDRTTQLGWMDAKGDVTFAPVGDGWYVLSGTTAAGDIVYARTERMTACDRRIIYGTIRFEYRAEHSAAIEPLIGPAAKTLGAAPCQ